MPDQLQLRGGTTVQHSTFTGASKEVTVDTTKKTAVVHDGSTVGGSPLMREDASNSALALGSAATPSLKFTGDTNTGIYSPGADQVAVATNGGERLRITSNGELAVPGGIGPQIRFENQHSVTTDAAISTFDDASGTLLCLGSNFYFNNSGSETRYNTSEESAAVVLDRAGVINFLTGDTSLTATSRMRITSAGLVGVGTSSPQSILNLSSTGPVITLTRSNSPDTGSGAINFATSDNTVRWQVGTNQAVGAGLEINRGAGTNNAVYIDTSNRVGIGTTSPTDSLHIFNTGTANYAINIDNYGSDPSNYIAFSGNATKALLGKLFRPAGINSIRLDVNFGDFIVGTGAGGTATERARIDSSGRLLVGTSSSIGFIGSTAATLQAVNTSTQYALGMERATNDTSGPVCVFRKTRSTSNGGNTIVSSADDLGYIRFAGTDGSAAVLAAEIKAQVDGTPGTNDMPGRIVFSTTADGASSPTERMRISSDGSVLQYGNGNGITAASAQGAGTVFALFRGRHSASSTTTGTISFLVYTNGNVENTNNSYGAISDIKLKENIVDASSQWDDLKALQVRNYNFKEGQTHTQIGLVAQEVELVSPGLVTESPDRDEDGNDLGTVTKSVNYSVLYMKAVKALQEAMERIEALEARLTAAGL